MPRILLGHVAVDSAQLIVADPSYLGKWIRSTDVEPYALNCFGREVKALVERLQTSTMVERVESLSEGRWFRVYPAAGYTVSQLNEAINRINEENGWTGATTPAAHDSYEAASALTSNGKGGGELLLTGSSGFAIAVRLAGDGSFPVYLVTDDAGIPMEVTVELSPRKN
jgi:hypothetical protein